MFNIPKVMCSFQKYLTKSNRFDMRTPAFSSSSSSEEDGFLVTGWSILELVIEFLIRVILVVVPLSLIRDSVSDWVLSRRLIPLIAITWSLTLMRPSRSVGPPGVIDTTQMPVWPRAPWRPTSERPSEPSAVFSISTSYSSWPNGAVLPVGATRTSLSVDVFDDRVESDSYT